ncbi:MAG: hypothetical protein AB3N33_02440 [Puniceicoccaceae bacterium]
MNTEESIVPDLPPFTTLSVSWTKAEADHLAIKWSASDDGNLIGSIATGDLSGRFSIRLDFSNWTKENYVFMPTAVYAGNRFPATPQPYSPCPVPMPLHTPPHLLQVTDIARLSFEDGPSKLERVAADAGTPGFGIYFPAQGKAFFLQTENLFDAEAIKFVVEENDARDEASLTVSAQSKGIGSVFNLWWSSFHCQSQAEFFAHFWKSRKVFFAANETKHEIPFSACWEIQEAKFNRDNWWDEKGFYTVGVDRDDGHQVWQAGWVGGLISTLPLLQHGKDISVARSRKTFDLVFPDGISPSGLPYAGFDGENWYCDRESHGKADWVLIRRAGDVLYFGLRQLMLMKDGGQSIKPTWEEGLRQIADALVRVWKHHGQFGQYVSHDTGEIIVPNTTCGAMAPGALVMAHRYFGSDDYLRVAVESGKRYREVDLELGVSSGGPGDINQCPDSESIFSLVESYALLADETSDTYWHEAGKLAAAHAASWTLSYDYAFPPESSFGKLDIRTTGSVFASTQNRHDAPGICTFSGEGFLRLFRQTGEVLFLDLLRDIAHGLPQYLSREDKPIHCTLPWPAKRKEWMLPGWMSERVNVTPNWGEPIGEVSDYSSWAETSLMLSWSDLPGVYFDASNQRVWALDHVDVQLLEDGSLKISNPTQFDATVKVLCERTEDRKIPLPTNFGASLQRIKIPANGVKVISV